jgi:hypothetical protein
MQYTRARFCGLSALVLLLATCALLFAQAITPRPFRPSGVNGTWAVMDYALTTSAVNLANLTASSTIAPPPPNTTVFLCGGDINASAGTSATVTIQDGTGGYFWNGIVPLSTTQASSTNIPLGTGGSPVACRPFPAGIVVSASSGSTFTFSGWGVY